MECRVDQDGPGARMNLVSATFDWLTDPAHWSGADGITTRLLQHVGYTALTLLIASAIAIPLGLWIGHTGRFRSLAIGLSSALRAIPTLGVLTLIVLISGIGLMPPIIALVILAIPPLLAGAYSGLESVDRNTIDAARAMGMTEGQILRKVEIPLAAPLLIGGIRSAALQVIATATVAAYVALGGLGRYLFDGIALRDTPKMLAGAVLVIVIALVFDALFAAMQKFAVGGRLATVR